MNFFQKLIVGSLFLGCIALASGINLEGSGVTSPFNIALVDAGALNVANNLTVGGTATVAGLTVPSGGISLAPDTYIVLDNVGFVSNMRYKSSSGFIEIQGTTTPNQDNSYDLGGTALNWRNIILSGKLLIDSTDQSADCDNAATGNASVGKICIQAGQGSMVLTNSSVTASSLIQLTNISDDTTCLSGYATVGSGTVTIGCVGAATATANTVFSFHVIN